jgi:hypothetical protein
MRKALLLIVALAGCDDSMLPANQRLEVQTEYDLTVNDDRAKFHEQDMTFTGSVGPYAIYRVIGENPKLIGPYVQARRDLGYAMLCGGHKYFTDDNRAGNAMMTLHGGMHGELELCHSEQEPVPQGGCSPPKDVFGNPLPDGGSMDTSDDMGPSQPPMFNPPGDNSGDDGGAKAITPPTDGDVHQITVALTQTPPVGSTVLVRRVALTNERQHNGSHVIPDICCENGVCTLH